MTATVTPGRVMIGKFRPTFHALEQMADRGISAEQVQRVLEDPERTLEDPRGRGCVKYTLGDIGAVVDPKDNDIITVYVLGVSDADDAAIRASNQALRDQAPGALRPSTAVQPLTQRMELPASLFSAPEAPVAPVRAVQRPVRPPSGAPTSFRETTVEEYRLYWFKRYRAMGFVE